MRKCLRPESDLFYFMDSVAGSYESSSFRVLLMSWRKFGLLVQRVKQSAHFLEAKVQCFHHSHLVFMSINIEAFSLKFFIVV